MSAPAKNFPVGDEATFATCSGLPSTMIHPLAAAFRAEVDDPVGRFDDIQVVLDADQCIAGIHEFV